MYVDIEARSSFAGHIFFIQIIVWFLLGRAILCYKNVFFSFSDLFWLASDWFFFSFVHIFYVRLFQFQQRIIINMFGYCGYCSSFKISIAFKSWSERSKTKIISKVKFIAQVERFCFFFFSNGLMTFCCVFYFKMNWQTQHLENFFLFFLMK